MTTRPHDNEEGRAFYQQRIALLNRVIFTLSFGFFAVGNSIGLALGVTQFADLVKTDDALHLASAFVACAVWLVARRGVLSARVLEILDTIAVTAQSVAYAAMAVATPPAAGARPDMLITIIVMVLLMLRAVLIPSTARRTVAVGVAALIPVVVGAYAVAGPYTATIPQARFFAITNAGLWSVIAIVVTALASRVIYGLRREVEAARRLGQYTLQEKIGEGGMGEVYKAKHALLRRPTAIKLLRRDRMGEQTLARFEREVQLTSQLTHPNTIQVYDFGRTPDGSFYYAMEYLDGVSLDELIEIDGVQPASRVIALLAQVCGSLAEAHAVGLIHRDIKPANLVVCERGQIADVAKVLDFGLVKVVRGGEAAGASHAADAITGTPLYMAPEAITAADRVDARADLYAIGAVAYYLLVGRHVFEAETIVEICAHHLHTNPEPPSARVEGIPADLEAIVLACLAKSVSDRPKNAADLRARLFACADATAWTPECAAAWWTKNRERVRARRTRAATSNVGFLTTRLADAAE